MAATTNPMIGNGGWSYPVDQMPTTPNWGITKTVPSPLQRMSRYDNVLQVLGEEGAKAFQVGPRSRVLLMDSNKPVFYLKQSDDSGYSEIKAYEFHEIPLSTNAGPAADDNREEKSEEKQAPAKFVDTMPSNAKFVTKEDFDEFKKMIENLVMKNA